jgi:N-acetylglucosaminyldiphosphoundecaprenol N-acetyl-beta-D-mannosaminyltransferase
MKKEIQLLGMTFSNYSLREELMIAQEALKDERLHMFLTVSMQSLVRLNGSGSEQAKSCVEQADLILVGDPEILSVAGITASQRIHEAREHLFFVEFLKRLVRGQQQVYLLASTTAALEKLKEMLAERYEKLQIVGEYSIEDYPEDLDRLINEINIAAPDVVLSVMPAPDQEEFLAENRSKLLAKLWYGLGDNFLLPTGKKGVRWHMRHLIHFSRFKLHVNQYDESDEESKGQ